MNCPNCEKPLRIYDRHGVEIDLCPTCRGVWLDRGELDKIIERVSRHFVEVPLRDCDEDDARARRNLPPRRSTFWQELFD
jgi:Zn-finger nucleic acid-binding protein